MESKRRCVIEREYGVIIWSYVIDGVRLKMVKVLLRI